MKIKNKYQLLFFLVLFLVVLTLTGGYIFKKYSDEGSILGFKIEKVVNTPSYRAPSNPTVTVFFKENPIQNQHVGIPTLSPIVIAPLPSIPPITNHEIKIINYPETVKLNDTSTFTWQISGPETKTGYTVIVGSKESKSGNIDDKTGLEKTPYRVLVKEFTNGTYDIPLTYIGNTVMPEYGIWYIRALVLINDKNIWSDEYTLTVN